MNSHQWAEGRARTPRPALIVPYMWIGDFVRCHSVVQVLQARAFRIGPVDILSTTLCAPLADYMPGLRQAIVVDLPRKRLALTPSRGAGARASSARTTARR